MMYTEIVKLQWFCMERNVTCSLDPLFDGFKLSFPSGADFVQHFGSYGSDHGCLEPAGVDENYDYSAVSLTRAKKLILQHREALEARS